MQNYSTNLSMRKILIIGSGKSTPYLIKFLLDKAPTEQLELTVAGINTKHIKQHATHLKTIPLNILKINARQSAIKNSDLVISMLPASKHMLVAKDCLQLNKHLLTASYVSPEMKALNKEVTEKRLIFLNEMGLDPGIDHMSAMQHIDQIKKAGGKINLFKSYTGGLVAPETKTGLWNYKFTWNPRNVVIAGQGGAAKFLQDAQYKYIPYQQLFKRTENINIQNLNNLEAYANRDALKYLDAYGLNTVKTLFRGTLRHQGFCEAWHAFVYLGMTDDSYTIDCKNMSYQSFTNLFLPQQDYLNTSKKLQILLNISQEHPTWQKLNALNLFSNTKKITLAQATPAQILEHILKQSWTLKPTDKDMIIMHHVFGYTINQKEHLKTATLITYGQDNTYTAMAKTVGLPLGMAALAILNKKITTVGVQIPTSKQIYMPVLEALKSYGITFIENTKLI